MEPPPRLKRSGISSLANKFESPEVKEARRKREAEDVRKALEVENAKRLKAEQERAILDQVKKKELEERLAQEQLELEQRLAEERQEEEDRLKQEESQRRIMERRKLMEEEEDKLSSLKPAVALFLRNQQNLKSQDEVTVSKAEKKSLLSNHGVVGDIQRKLMRKKEEARDFEKELKEMTEKAVREAHDEENKAAAAQANAKKSKSSVEIYTKGNCNHLKSSFESQIALKKSTMNNPGDNLPTPTTRRKSMQQRITQRSGNLPNMFQQQAKRNKELEEQRGVKDRIPIDKKIFSNSLNKFEDEDSRKAARGQLQKFTFKQKEKEKASWSQKQEQAKIQKEEEKRRKKKEEEEAAEAVKRKKKEQEEQERQRKEEEELARNNEKAAKAKSKLKRRPSTKRVNRKELKEIMEPKDLPKIIPPTTSAMKQKLEETKGIGTPKKPQTKVGKLSINSFQKQFSNDSSNPASPISPGGSKPLVIPAMQRNALSDLKKKFGSSSLVDATSLKKNQIERNHAKPENIPDSPEEEEMEFFDASEEPLVEIPEEVPEQIFQHEKENSEPPRAQPKSKKSKEEMQNYLISKVLFDNVGKTSKPKKDSIEDLVDDSPVEVDPEYVKEMEKYLSLIDQTPKKKTKKNKENSKLKKEAEKLKVFDVKNIKNKFEMTKQQSKSFQTQKSTDNPPIMPIDAKVDRFKSVFEGSNNGVPRDDEQRPTPPRRKMISNDLLNKFDDPEAAAKLKEKRQMDLEERRMKQMILFEEKRKREEQDRIEALQREKERKEILRREELKRQEEERLQKLEKEREKKALEKAFAEERERIKERKKKEEEALIKKEKEEKQRKKNKVLNRISHMFEKNEEAPDVTKNEAMGSIRGMAEEMFATKRNPSGGKSNEFRDPTLTGVSSVLSRVKRQLEAKEETPTISRGVEKRKGCIPAAMAFEIKEHLMTTEKELQESKIKSPNPEATQWAWKSKKPEELLVRTNSTGPNTKRQERSNKRPERTKLDEEKQKSLLDDIHAVTDRLKLKDVERDHNEKMMEYEQFMADIQDYLNEPTEDFDEADYKHDIQEYLEYRFDRQAKKSQPKAKVPNLALNSVEKVKSRLENNSRFTKTSLVGQSKSIGNVKELQQMLLDQEESEFERKPNHLENVSSVNMERVKNAFEEMNNDLIESSAAPRSKVRVKKKIIEMPSLETSTIADMPQPSYQWKYKQKNIESLQKFLDTNAHLVPHSVADKLDEVRANLDEDNEDDFDKTEDLKIDEYSEFLEEVDRFLSAPDRSKTEGGFKAEIEKYLDLIDEPEKPNKSNIVTPIQRVGSIKRKPKKMNLIEFNPINQVEQKKMSPTIQRDNKLVAQLQSKLIQEFEKTDPKDEIHLPTVETNTLKKNFEKLSQKEEPSLLGSREIVLQRGLDHLTSNQDSQSLEALKAEREKVKWRWKEKQVQDLKDFIKSKDKAIPEQIKKKKEEHEELEKERELREVQAKAENNVNEIKRIREEKEKDFESFINEVKDCLNSDLYERSEQNEDLEIKTGLNNFVQLFDQETKVRRPVLKSRPKSMVIGDVCVRRELLKHQMREDQSPELNKKSSDLWKVGRVDTSPFIKGPEDDEGEDEDDEDEEDEEHGSSSLRRNASFGNALTSARREALENAFSQEREEKPFLRSRVPKKLIDTSMFEMKANEQKPTLTAKAVSDWKWKKKNIQELQSFMAKNTNYMDSKSSILQNETMKRERTTSENDEDFSQDRVQREADESEGFLNEVNDYLNAQNRSTNEDKFKETIQIYLDLIENNDKPTAPRERSRRFKGSKKRVTNLRKSIIEQQAEKAHKVQQSLSVGKLNLDFDPLESNTNFEKQSRPIPQDGKYCGLVRQKLEREDSVEYSKPLRKAPKAKIIDDSPKLTDNPPIKKPIKKWVPRPSNSFDQLADQASSTISQANPQKWSYKEKEAERKAAILARYGLKEGSDDDNVSLNLDFDDDLEMPEGVLNHLPKEYVTIEERGKRLTSKDDGSFGALKNIMGLMKKGQVNQAFKKSKHVFSSEEKGLDRLDSDESEMGPRASQVLCSNIRDRFESGSVFQSHMDEHDGMLKSAVPKSKSCASMRAMFEEDTSPSPVPTRRIPGEVMSSSDRVRRARKSLIDPQARNQDLNRQFSLGEDERPGESSMSLRGKYERNLSMTGWDGSTDSLLGEGRQRLGSSSLHKSSSFNKFRDAFETGKVEDLHHDEDENQGSETRPTGVRAELEALRSCDRIQKIMRINKPREQLERSRPSLSRSKTTACVDLDEETLEEVSRSKSAIRNMFEAQGPKIRFGGGASKSPQNHERGVEKSSSADNSSQGAKPKKSGFRGLNQEKEQFKERKWVFDTINKYFDVIKEDKEAEDDEEDEETTNMSSAFSSQLSLNSPMGSSSNLTGSKWGGGYSPNYYPSPSGSSLQVPPERSSFTPGMKSSSSLEPSHPLTQPPSPPSRRSSLRKNLNSTPYQLRSSKSFGPDSNPYLRGSNTSLNSMGSSTSLNMVSRSPSHAKLKGMLEQVMKSKPDMNLDVFKQNLKAHLDHHSRENLSEQQPSPSRFTRSPSWQNDDPEEENSKYFVVPL
ncbi:trichohyalin-like [Tigriopus californicus]|uniref:trichohyalin-like n=1 Tax=Tigriopus californicus TaxID=6832 RepID=UPI0027DA0EF8|nr:trichohyalin-like [Tigriopus californicus]